MGPDQLHGLFRVILAATAAGTLVSAWTLRPTRLWAPVAIALGLIAVGAFMDSHATNLVRPQNLYVSQSLLAFASALFIGPAMMIGISQVMQKGFANMVSFIIVFSAGQNIGGLAGSALVGTVQQVRARDYVSHLSERLIAGDPQVAQRLQQLGGAYGRTVGDAGLRGVEGLRLFQQQVTQQANVLAYNDVFLMLAVTALAAAGWTTFVHFRPRLKARREARAAARAVDAGPGAVDAVAAVE